MSAERQFAKDANKHHEPKEHNDMNTGNDLLTATLHGVGDDLSVDVATAYITVGSHAAPLRKFADAAHGDEWLRFAFSKAVNHLGYWVVPDAEEIVLTPGQTTFTVAPTDKRKLIDLIDGYAEDSRVAGENCRTMGGRFADAMDAARDKRAEIQRMVGEVYAR